MKTGNRTRALRRLLLLCIVVPLFANTPQQCEPVPVEPPRDTRCDDGSELLCDMAMPECGEMELPAIRNGCWECVVELTCRPWGEPGCRSDLDCPADEYCHDCATGSCPYCDDCVAACVPHACETEPYPQCNMVRPECDRGQTAVVRDGCWVCVDLQTCEPTHDARCDDGTEPICLMMPPVCADYEILAYQNHCYACVNPSTCRPWGEPECRADSDCPEGEYCDRCATSSCPMCDDCVAACVTAYLPD